MNQLSLFDEPIKDVITLKESTTYDIDIENYPSFLMDRKRTNEHIHGLTIPEMDELNQYINNKKEISAHEAASLLVEKCSSPKKQFITGKLRIYPYVCFYFDFLENKNKLMLIVKQGTKDRIYKKLH